MLEYTPSENVGTLIVNVFSSGSLISMFTVTETSTAGLKSTEHTNDTSDLTGLTGLLGSLVSVTNDAAGTKCMCCSIKLMVSSNRGHQIELRIRH